ncbi:MAG TPA: thiazole synthase, partial [Spirochaetota bacterium]|nr:thiazole synthase [Spirochaetota bacterium]
RGLETKPTIEMIIENAKVPIIIDAGIGLPSHAAEAMEMGASAVLVNTAIACSENPERMGRAFSMAVKAGRFAYLTRMDEVKKYASASSPLTGFLRDE